MRKKIERNQEFWMAAGLTLLFVFVYICLCHPLYETSDDNAMAFFVEGAYGSRTGHLVFENLILGKIFSVLTGILPGVKWYTVIHYIGMVCAYVGISYFLMKVAGKRAGFVGSVFLLLILGMQSFVIFQWTRVAAVTTIGGMLLLFYGIEYAQSKWERIVTLSFGAGLCLMGSMIRFQFFAVCVVLSGGVVLLKMLEIVRERSEDWKKRIAVYFFVFGSVGIVSIALYAADRAYYMKDEAWSHYLEYNSLRGELWDKGFPDYKKNKKLYESLGISKQDMEMYGRWNIDEELLPAESLRALVEAKKKPEFSGNYLIKFAKVVSKSFLGMPLFGMFLIVSIVAGILDKRKLFLVVYEIVGFLAFELYFYWIGRYGLARIDMGMLAAGMVTVLCAISDDLKRIPLKCRWIGVLVCVFFITQMPVLSGWILQEPADKTNDREFTDMMSEDKENLYVATVPGSYDLARIFDFWEPVPEGGLSNISYMGGWEFNVPVKNAMLANYGVTNIYRDSIDNPHMYLVVKSKDKSVVQKYIQENYNKNASMSLLKSINSNTIWRVTTGYITHLDGEKNDDLSEIEHEVKKEIKIKEEENILKISGYIYKKDANSFQQHVYVKVRDLKTKVIRYKELTMSQLKKHKDLMNGKYSNISGSIELEKGHQYEISVVLQADGQLYEVDELINDK